MFKDLKLDCFRAGGHVKVTDHDSYSTAKGEVRYLALDGDVLVAHLKSLVMEGTCEDALPDEGVFRFQESIFKVVPEEDGSLTLYCDEDDVVFEFVPRIKREPTPRRDPNTRPLIPVGVVFEQFT